MARGGQLRHRVIIQVNTTSQSGRGEVQASWATAWTVWAAIYPERGSETNAGKQTVGQVTHKIRIRYDADTTAGVTTAHRVLFGTRVFEINSIIRGQEHNRVLDLMCIETQIG